jgi:predicted nucleotidyltransferase component of viral defense system
MQKDYYQNILYPLQDNILSLIASLPVDFYLTGGTALSRAYLNHRYSDDLDFFVNRSVTFNEQVENIVGNLPRTGLKYEVTQADEGFARIFVYDRQYTLKLDFINDVLYRSEVPVSKKLFRLTDTIRNILSNKITALCRLSAKDVADIVYIAKIYPFDWPSLMSEAFEKDMWVNPIEVGKILDEFHIQKLNEINWVDDMPDQVIFESQLKVIIKDLLQGNQNSLYTPQSSSSI